MFRFKNTEDHLDFIYILIDYLLSKGNCELVDSMLDGADIPKMGATIAVAYMGSTFKYRANLTRRKYFIKRFRDHYGNSTDLWDALLIKELY